MNELVDELTMDETKKAKCEEEYKQLVVAVGNGEKKAKTKHAWYKLTGCGGAEIDKDDAVALLEERVKDKDSEAMWMLGLCYEFGMGCEQDVEEAVKLYKLCCDSWNEIGKFLCENRISPTVSDVEHLPWKPNFWSLLKHEYHELNE